jgi:hypothetical protein
MLSLAEIGPAIYGAWRLAWFDPNGMRYFDQSLNGFWRSFRVAILAAPFTALLIALDLSHEKLGGGWFRVLAGESIAYVIGWVAFPLLAYYLTEAIDRRGQYLGFIVAYNWSTLIQLAVILPAALIAQSGILPVGLAVILTLAAYAAILVYEWFVVRTALALSVLGAAGVVLIDFVLSWLISDAGDFMALAR